MGRLFFALKPLFVGNILRLYVFAGFFPLSLEREKISPLMDKRHEW